MTGARRPQRASRKALPISFKGALCLGVPPNPFLFRLPIAEDHEGQSHEDPRYHARHEQLSDRSLGDDPVDDEGDAGGDQDGDLRGRSHQGHGIGLVISIPDHGRDRYEPDGGYGGRPGTRDSAEEAATDHGDHGEPSPDVTDKGIDQVDQPSGDPRPLHRVASKDEKGDGQESKFRSGRI